MAKQFLVDLNLNKNELQNAKIQNLVVAPNNATAGQIYYNTVDKELKLFDGTNWVSVGDGYTLPIATSSVLGGVLAKAKTNNDTVEVAIDSTGKLYIPTYPTIGDLGGISSTEKGAINGVATLGADGKVPSSQLPSYVDDVIEGYFYNSKFYEEDTHTTEITGESGKIYVDLVTNKSYRWSGTTYIEIAQANIHKYTETITGDGNTTSFSISHGLNSRDIVVNVYDTSTFEDVVVDITRTSTSAITVSFAVAPIIGNDYKVVIVA